MDEALIVQELRLEYPFKDLLDISKIARSSYYYLIKKSTKVNNKKLYLSPIMDLYNSEIISYSIGYRPDYSLVKSMLTKTLKKVNNTEGIILHSDQG